MKASESKPAFTRIGPRLELVAETSDNFDPRDALGADCTDCGLVHCQLAALGRQLTLLVGELGARTATLPTKIEDCVWHQHTPAPEASAEEKLLGLKQQLAGIAHLLQLLGWPDAAERYSTLALQDEPTLGSLYVEATGRNEQHDAAAEEPLVSRSQEPAHSRFILSDPFGEDGDAQEDEQEMKALRPERMASPEIKRLVKLLEDAIESFDLFTDVQPPWKTGVSETATLLTAPEISRLIQDDLSQVTISLASELHEVQFDPEFPDDWVVYLPQVEYDEQLELVHAQLVVWLLWSTRNAKDSQRLKLSKNIGAQALNDFQLHEESHIIATLKARCTLAEYIHHFSPNGFHVLLEE